MTQKSFYTGKFNIWQAFHLVILSLLSTAYSDDDTSDNDDDLFVNTNHPPPIEVQDTSSTDSDSWNQ